jgi:hypothetical protein
MLGHQKRTMHREPQALRSSLGPSTQQPIESKDFIRLSVIGLQAKEGFEDGVNLVVRDGCWRQDGMIGA